MVIFKTKTGIIPANETEVLFTDLLIKDDSIIEIYYDDNNVYTVESVQSGTSVHIVTSAHTNQVGVKLFINNVSEFSPYDDSALQSKVRALENEVSAIDSDLTTIHSAVTSHSNEIINLRAHMTNIETEMTDFDERLDECFQSVSNGKTLVASAITDKGVDTLATDTFEVMADNISQIESGGGTEISNIYTPLSSNYNNNNDMIFTASHDGIAIVYTFISGSSNPRSSVQTVTDTTDSTNITFKSRNSLAYGTEKTQITVFNIKKAHTYSIHTSAKRYTGEVITVEF